MTNLSLFLSSAVNFFCFFYLILPGGFYNFYNLPIKLIFSANKSIFLMPMLRTVPGTSFNSVIKDG